jgi:hypothetical protein
LFFLLVGFFLVELYHICEFLSIIDLGLRGIYDFLIVVVLGRLRRTY